MKQPLSIWSVIFQIYEKHVFCYKEWLTKGFQSCILDWIHPQFCKCNKFRYRQKCTQERNSQDWEKYHVSDWPKSEGCVKEHFVQARPTLEHDIRGGATCKTNLHSEQKVNT